MLSLRFRRRGTTGNEIRDAHYNVWKTEELEQGQLEGVEFPASAQSDTGQEQEESEN